MSEKPSNVLTRIAAKFDRDYVTPEDVPFALAKYAERTVWKALLECLARNLCEDASLCAFVALKGKAAAVKEVRSRFDDPEDGVYWRKAK